MGNNASITEFSISNNLTDEAKLKENANPASIRLFQLLSNGNNLTAFIHFRGIVNRTQCPNVQKPVKRSTTYNLRYCAVFKRVRQIFRIVHFLSRLKVLEHKIPVRLCQTDRTSFNPGWEVVWNKIADESKLRVRRNKFYCLDFICDLHGRKKSCNDNNI